MAGIFTFFPWIKNEFYYESVWNCLCEENRSINILLRFFFFCGNYSFLFAKGCHPYIQDVWWQPYMVRMWGGLQRTLLSLSLWVCVRVFSPPTLFWPWGVCRKCPAHAASDENQQQLRTDLRGCCLEAEMLKPGVQRSTDQTGSRVEFVFLTWWSGDTSWLLANRALAAHTVTLRRLISPLYPEK